ncbi:MAG: ECF-type sigma factor [Gemmataceae bacterium]
MNEVTQILNAVNAGRRRHAVERLFPLVYDELRRMASRRIAQEKAGQTLQLRPRLVHEAYLRPGGRRAGQHWSRSHFFTACGEAMRASSSIGPAAGGREEGRREAAGGPRQGRGGRRRRAGGAPRPGRGGRSNSAGTTPSPADWWSCSTSPGCRSSRPASWGCRGRRRHRAPGRSPGPGCACRLGEGDAAPAG